MRLEPTLVVGLLVVTMVLLVTIWRVLEDDGDVVEPGDDQLVPFEASPA